MFLTTAMALAEEKYNLYSQLTLLCDHVIAHPDLPGVGQVSGPADFLVRRTASRGMQTDSTSGDLEFLVVVAMCVSEIWSTDKLPVFLFQLLAIRELNRKGYVTTSYPPLTNQDAQAASRGLHGWKDVDFLCP
jgi:hypothetical protein